MREHIKAFLLASSLAFGIRKAQRERILGVFHEQANATREPMKRVHREREKLALLQSQTKGLRDFTFG